MRSIHRTLLLAPALTAAMLVANPAHAVHFSYLNPAYVQEIYAGPLIIGQEAGMAWTTGNNLLTRAGSSIIEYSLTQNTTYQGTSLHGVIATHAISGLNNTGYGMTNGTDGYIYAITGGGLQRFDPGNWAAPAQTLTNVGGPGYGITTLSDGRIAYAAGSGSDVYVYDPVNLTNSLIFTANTLIDDMAASSANEIVLAGQGNASLIIIDWAGSWINTLSNLIHYPDGLTFGDGLLSTSIFSNNNDGTITEYQFGLGFANAPTLIYDIATGGGAYGDLAEVGPDCAFYVFHGENGSYHGATPGVGTNWDNMTTTTDAAITRIAAAPSGDGGLPTCGFRTPVVTSVVPVPGAWLLLGSGLATLASLRRKQAVQQG
ncbi:MAG: hypothetical protein JNK40_14135 [Chromatiales bacterium]|nr:hypothetical protein [Chromatiales bacterium]